MSDLVSDTPEPERKCGNCQQCLPLGAFSKDGVNRTGLTGLSAWCADCRDRQRVLCAAKSAALQQASAAAGALAPEGTDPTWKRCCRCEAWQPRSAYNANNASKDKLSPHCRACSKTNQRKDARFTHLAEGSASRLDEFGKYKLPGSVRLDDDLPGARIAHFFAETHSREFLLDLCVMLGIVDEAAVSTWKQAA